MEISQEQLDAIKDLVYRVDRASNDIFRLKKHKGVTTLEFDHNILNEIRRARELVRIMLEI